MKRLKICILVIMVLWMTNVIAMKKRVSSKKNNLTNTKIRKIIGAIWWKNKYEKFLNKIDFLSKFNWLENNVEFGISNLETDVMWLLSWNPVISKFFDKNFVVESVSKNLLKLFSKKFNELLYLKNLLYENGITEDCLGNLGILLRDLSGELK
jgi:hypothetical protein